MNSLESSFDRMREKLDKLIDKIDALSNFRAQTIAVAGIMGAAVSLIATWVINRALPALVLVLLVAGDAGAQSIPGVPTGCCGKADCIPASVRFLGWEMAKAVVRVNGKVIRIDPGSYSTSKFGQSYYCFQAFKDCFGVVSDKCARCAIEAPGYVRAEPVNPMAMIIPLGGPSGTLHFLAERDCARCHK